MRTSLACLAGTALALVALPAAAAVIDVSPADGTTAYMKIEGAGPGDEVVIAPGTYAFRVYLQTQAPASQPIYIHAADPTNPPVWDLGSTLVEDAPGSYTGGDNGRGCWQVSGGTNYTIEGIVFQSCHNGDEDSAGIRYYNGAAGIEIKSCLFQDNDNGLTGGTEDSEATVELCEFAHNGTATAAEPTHNIYVFGGTFTLLYSYLHDPVAGQNLHCRAVTSTIEYNWFDRAATYAGDLMTSDDYANGPMTAKLTQAMTLRGNVVIQGADQVNDSQIWAVFNDEASGAPVSFSVTAQYNTVIGAGGHAAFVHLANGDGTQMAAQVDDNIVSGTSQPILVDDATAATVSGTTNWLQTGADATGLSASITGASPGFTDAASLDFELASGSACIGAATSVDDPPVDEYYENETVTLMYRVRATARDLGAFEHTTTGPGIGPDGPTEPADGGAAEGGAPDAGSGAGGDVAAGGSAASGGGGGAGSSSVSSGTGGAAGTPQKSSGCSCSTTESRTPPAALWAIAIASVATWRRRRRS